MYKTFLILFVFQNIFCQTIPENFITTGFLDDECFDEDPEPVCGGDGRTYQNDCYSAVAGVNVAYSGECVKCE